MQVFWGLMTCLWLVAFLLLDGYASDHAAIMAMISVVLLNIEGIKRKIGGE